MTKTSFTPGNNYQTRDGRPARVYATDGSWPFPIHGAVQNDRGDWISWRWPADGVEYSNRLGAADLLMAKENRPGDHHRSPAGRP